MKNSVKVAAFIIYFFVLLFAGDRLLSLLLKEFVLEQSNFRYTRLYEGNADCEILFLGNSRGLPFYQPYIELLTGKRTFNMSYNGMPSNLGVVLLQDYLEHNNKPELVIIEATMPGRRKGLVLNFACYSTFSPRLKDLIYSESEKAGYFNDIFHLSRYNNEVFQRSLYYLNKSDTTWLNDRVMPERALEEDQEASVAAFDPYTADDFKKMIEICKAHNLPYKFVINPYYPGFVEGTKDQNQLRDQLSAYLKEPIYDYSLSIEPHDYFADYKHVNKKGSRLLIQKLFDDGIFSADK